MLSFLGTGAARCVHRSWRGIALRTDRAIAAPLNPAYTTKEYQFYLGDTKPVVLLLPRSAGKSHPAVQAAELEGIRVAHFWLENTTIRVETVLAGKKTSSTSKQSGGDPEPNDVALVLHTSGTTGRPKSVPLSHHNLVTTTGNIVRTYELTSKDVTYLVMPLFHVHGLLAGLLSPFRSGGTVVVPDKFSAGRFWSDFVRYGCNWYTAGTCTSALQKSSRDCVQCLRYTRSCSARRCRTLCRKYDSFAHARPRSHPARLSGLRRRLRRLCSRPMR